MTRNGRGRPPKHGARALQKLLDESSLDGRTKIAKLKQAQREELAEDSGGIENMTARELVILDRVVGQLLICRAIEDWVFSKPERVIDESTGDVAPVLQRTYGHYVNSIRLGLGELGLRPERSAKPTSLGEYIDSKGLGSDASVRR